MGIPLTGTARSSPDKAYATAVKRGAKDVKGQPGSLRLLEVDVTAMHLGVFGLGHYLEVFWAIVRAVVIHMMHDLIGSKVSTDLLLGNKPMLSNVSRFRGIGMVWNLDVDIALPPVHKTGRPIRQRAGAFYRLVIAGLTAKPLRFGSRWLGPEYLAAQLTWPFQRRSVSRIGTPVSVHAVTRAVSRNRNLGGADMEGLATVFALNVWGKMGLHAMSFHRVPRSRRHHPREIISLPQVYQNPSNNNEKGGPPWLSLSVA